MTTQKPIAALIAHTRERLGVTPLDGVTPKPVKRRGGYRPGVEYPGSFSAAELKTLERLWLEGIPTAEIGRRMGRSKNSIVGKAHRLGLPARESCIIKTGEKKAPSPRRMRAIPLPMTATVEAMPQPAPAPMPVPMPPPAPPKPAPQPVHVGTCLFPMWGTHETPTHVYCDEPRVHGSYCTMHGTLCYTRVAHAVMAGPATPL